MSVMTYAIISPEPEPRADVRIELEYDDKGAPETAVELRYSQDPDGTVFIYPTLRDLVRLGRVADAILKGKDPSRNNYDEVSQ